MSSFDSLIQTDTEMVLKLTKKCKSFSFLFSFYWKAREFNKPNFQELRANIVMTCCRENKTKAPNCKTLSYLRYIFIFVLLAFFNYKGRFESLKSVVSFLICTFQLTKDQRKAELPSCVWIYRLNALCGVVLTLEGTPN